MPSKLHFTESSLADRFAKDVLTDLPLVGSQFDISGLLVGFETNLI